ncbi:DUF4142 domain-containing protein [Cytophagaceae bacterium DM2B3-1]|uniref:DUF4142 domain-containing protein n=1 Tax=Xanthocytophaga flava TaxID=3048013 RepID=A0AAE3QQ35_9BACT|nr:DUF4142 domain-containing protein [Xanthocytophaga flavus]MDJ1469554.1 DUF4142 domain-containing protein [Xanthocytophaga flavus]MDJ1480804.1 DUF4142 domain-containing protein [Xanthocytophaga flavus]MDJ1493500.1 DUF4142 domain-containing protein [Xanthocytophaga flavus]
MTTYNIKLRCILAGAMLLAVTSLIPLTSFAQQSGNQASGNKTDASAMIGGMSRTELERINKEGAAKVAAVTADKKALSQKDQTLFMEVAKGGMQQLMLSQLAVQKASNDQIRQIAQAEVEEQNGLAAKLTEIASAKGVNLPREIDSQTQEMLSKLGKLTGSELDRFYMQESGVNGHEKLDKVMSMVESEASDSNLKSLAAAAHPLVRTHLKVSREVLNSMSNPVGNK